MSFLLCLAESTSNVTRQDAFISTALINIAISASAVVCGALAVEANRDDYVAAHGRTKLVGIVEALCNDSDGGILPPPPPPPPPPPSSATATTTRSRTQALLQRLHDCVYASPTPLAAGDVVLLGSALVNLVIRLTLTYSLPSVAAAGDSACVYVDRPLGDHPASKRAPPAAIFV